VTPRSEARRRLTNVSDKALSNPTAAVIGRSFRSSDGFCRTFAKRCAGLLFKRRIATGSARWM
jgi:hypothetical protein